MYLVLVQRMHNGMSHKQESNRSGSKLKLSFLKIRCASKDSCTFVVPHFVTGNSFGVLWREKLGWFHVDAKKQEAPVLPLPTYSIILHTS